MDDMDIDMYDMYEPDVTVAARLVINNAGGMTFAVDDWTRLRRFLCLGVEESIYVVRKQQKFEKSNEGALFRLIKHGHGAKVVAELLALSLAGRTAKQEPILFSLAACCRLGDDACRTAAYDAMPRICRIPTHLFTFVTFCEKMVPNSTGWGRAMRRAVQKWYTSKSPSSLAFTTSKYRNRVGWTHRDLLRLAHVLPQGAPLTRTERKRAASTATTVATAKAGVALVTQPTAQQLVLRYLVKGSAVLKEEGFVAASAAPDADPELVRTTELLSAIERLLAMTSTETLDEAVVVDLAQRFRLAREHLPTVSLNSAFVWDSLLDNMPLQALVRNLNKMTSTGLLTPSNTDAVQRVVNKLASRDAIRAARLHPYHILIALRMYERGKGEKGSLSWKPVPAIVRALNDAFYLGFSAVQPTQQNVLLALDVSGSMSARVLGSDVLSCREASMAMAMVAARTEPYCETVAFCDKIVLLQDYSIDLKKDTLAGVLHKTGSMPFGSTDCAQPMLYAIKRKLAIDTFIVFTDNETWSGGINPAAALRQYRVKAKRPNARLIVVGLASNEFTIADPEDPGMMDIAGFDANAPEIMRSFMVGEL